MRKLTFRSDIHWPDVEIVLLTLLIFICIWLGKLKSFYFVWWCWSGILQYSMEMDMRLFAFAIWCGQVLPYTSENGKRQRKRYIQSKITRVPIIYRWQNCVWCCIRASIKPLASNINCISITMYVMSHILLKCVAIWFIRSIILNWIITLWHCIKRMISNGNGIHLKHWSVDSKTSYSNLILWFCCIFIILLLCYHKKHINKSCSLAMWALFCSFFFIFLSIKALP